MQRFMLWWKQWELEDQVCSGGARGWWLGKVWLMNTRVKPVFVSSVKLRFAQHDDNTATACSFCSRLVNETHISSAVWNGWSAACTSAATCPANSNRLVIIAMALMRLFIQIEIFWSKGTGSMCESYPRSLPRAIHSDGRDLIPVLFAFILCQTPATTSCCLNGENIARLQWNIIFGLDCFLVQPVYSDLTIASTMQAPGCVRPSLSQKSRICWL